MKTKWSRCNLEWYFRCVALQRRVSIQPIFSDNRETYPKECIHSEKSYVFTVYKLIHFPKFSGTFWEFTDNWTRSNFSMQSGIVCSKWTFILF